MENCRVIAMATIYMQGRAASLCAALLSVAGGRAVTVEMLEVDVAAGAPANADGTLNPVHHAAWLVMQASGAHRQAQGQTNDGLPAAEA